MQQTIGCLNVYFITKIWYIPSNNCILRNDTLCWEFMHVKIALHQNLKFFNSKFKINFGYRTILTTAFMIWTYFCTSFWTILNLFSTKVCSWFLKKSLLNNEHSFFFTIFPEQIMLYIFRILSLRSVILLWHLHCNRNGGKIGLSEAYFGSDLSKIFHFHICSS